jgi:hypothetical protein
MTKNQQNHLSNALLFMCRYSYHRKTSADMASVSALKALWEFVPTEQRKKIIDEIETEIKVIKNHDIFLWKEFLEWSEK